MSFVHFLLRPQFDLHHLHQTCPNITFYYKLSKSQKKKILLQYWSFFFTISRSARSIVSFRIEIKIIWFVSNRSLFPTITYPERKFSLSLSAKSLFINCWVGGDWHFLIMGYWGCAAGWGHIFTAELTIMGSPFQAFLIEFTKMVSHFSGLWD